MDLTIRQRGGNAKMELQMRFAKMFKRQILPENFVTWDDGRLPHLARWTCIFVCPRTGEWFLCGDLMSDGGYAAQGLSWYETKKKAMEAAAGKAEDCFKLREGRGRQQFCNEQPYLEGTNVDLPAVPQQYCDEIQELRSQICRH
jgi:hypothetical protein